MIKELSPVFSVLDMLLLNITMNHSKEYWYMVSMRWRSAMQKNNTCARFATGMYNDLVKSIFACVISAVSTFIYI